MTLLKENTRDIIAVGNKVGKLYKLPIRVSIGKNPRVFFTTKNNISLDYVWHLRMAYISKKSIRYLYNNIIESGYITEKK